MASERWQVVPSLPSVEASSEGRLRVVPYWGPTSRGRGTRLWGGVATTGQWDGKRFIYPHRGKTYKVARLVCEAFHGSAPAGRLYCLHQDEDSRNNRPENLTWGTQKENLNAPGFLAYCRTRRAERRPEP